MANKLSITLVRSLIGRPETQRRTVAALGLRKLHQTVVHEDTPVIRGMVEKVRHLVKVQTVDAE
ncbi:50S ribosomal protein L30 [Alicyclobacillus cellulosilyticus]|uniref:Large ribosomal subunit protein uL30 n=1 Tax=Alicyclobacillus cellulosilyticus TaxID=1003997 RepID=A0A917K7D7_9BACL|nr:50S ribosomal protein L30 [Alicyclobacillus cellulosilyticus]GGJ00939.1 50S ribosomal protein L30 [Alicyclobacillus cellulosilyticus]